MVRTLVKDFINGFFWVTKEGFSNLQLENPIGPKWIVIRNFMVDPLNQMHTRILHQVYQPIGVVLHQVWKGLKVSLQECKETGANDGKGIRSSLNRCI